MSNKRNRNIARIFFTDGSVIDYSSREYKLEHLDSLLNNTFIAIIKKENNKLLRYININEIRVIEFRENADD